MIKRLLRNLRQKPKIVRDQIALGAAGIFTAVVGSIWLYHVPARFASLEEKKPLADQPAFFDVFSNMRDQLATVREAEQEAAEATSTTEEPTPMSNTATSSWLLWGSASTTEASAGTSTSRYVGSTTPSTYEPVPAPTASAQPYPIRIVTTSKTATTGTSTAGSE